MWHAEHGVAVCFPTRGKRVCACSTTPKSVGRKPPSCGSLALAAREALRTRLVLVLVAVDAAREGELSVSLLARHRRLVAARARRLVVLAGERVFRLRVRGEADRARQPEPQDDAVTVPARASERRLVHGSVARDALAPFRRRDEVSSVVARPARDRRVTVREAHARVLRVRALERDGLPLRVLVAVRAGRAELARVRILVAVVHASNLRPVYFGGSPWHLRRT